MIPTEALTLDDTAFDLMVEDWVHCAVGHGNSASFVAKYIRASLRDRVQKPLAEALIASEDETARRIAEWLRKHLGTDRVTENIIAAAIERGDWRK